MKNYYKGTKENPYHLSVGAVILNDENKVCCHYYKDAFTKQSPEKYRNIYTLMRETIEMGENIEEALHRGLMEEFGITGEIITYIGSLKGYFPTDGVQIEKTTLYFTVKLKTFNPELRSKDDIERKVDIQFQDADFLISKMKDQGQRLDQALDESAILERIILNK